MFKKTIFVVALICSLSACQKPVEHAQFYVFGTLVDITLADVDKAQAQQILAQVQQDLQQMHNDWHPWKAGMLVGINRAFSQGRCAPLDQKLKQLIIASQKLERQTGGNFNAGIGGLVALWGFHTSDYPIQTPPPSAVAIDEWLQYQPSTQSVYFQGDSVCSSNPATQLDFGGIAKGYAVDLIVDKLKAAGVAAAIVNTGGDLRAYSEVERQYWHIAVRHPQQGLIGLIEITADDAVFTSGNYQRYVEHQGQRYAHILDPRSGRPVSDIVAVTVLAASGLQADAAATALMVSGLQGWLELSKDLQLEAVLVVDEAGKLYMTSAMEARLALYEHDDEDPQNGADAKPSTEKSTNGSWEIEIVE
ncbi:MAG: FAD:protein FMN transferase [Xanthomonadales bacterium]|nr:FAD:protein FMN transferase [Xanthomonadales bacterium]